MALVILGLAAVAGLGIYYSTEPAIDVDAAPMPQDQGSAVGGISQSQAAIDAQDARENGFLRGRRGMSQGITSSTFAADMTVLHPGATSAMKMTDFKTALQADMSKYNDTNLRFTFDHENAKPIPRATAYRPPLIGLPHANAEVRSGQNASGQLSLLSSNPGSYVENKGKTSRIKEASGMSLSQTFGSTNNMNYDKHSETRMSWDGLRNPWNIGGTMRNLVSFTPPDKDQLRGAVPLNNPRAIFGSDGAAGQIQVPPGKSKGNVKVFNRGLQMGRPRSSR